LSFLLSAGRVDAESLAVYPPNFVKSVGAANGSLLPCVAAGN
jgi:hypothetical protein